MFKSRSFFHLLVLIVAIFETTVVSAQATMEIAAQWDFTSYSDDTVANLAADPDHWTYNSKGRYVNAVETDGLPLVANGVEIAETSGVIIGAGVNAGSFLLRHAMGANNGMQIERATTVSFSGTNAGDGCDEIVYGSASVDHDGTLIYRTGLGHGDALHWAILTLTARALRL